MKVVIETQEPGVSWKLQTIADGRTLAASLVYFPSMEACIQDLGVNARAWKSHLPDRSVSSVGEVRLYTNGTSERTLGDLWPEL